MTAAAPRTPRIEPSEPARPAGPAKPTETAQPAPRGSHRRLVFIALGVALIVVIGVVVRWITTSKRAASVQAAAESQESRGVPVAVAPATTRDVPVYLDGLGNAVPLATVTVKTQVDGRLDQILFREGQAVKKGDVLAQIDPRPFTIQLHQAEAALARDTAQMKNAQLNLERYIKLGQQKLIAQQQVDDQQAMVNQNEASVKADQTQIESARLQLDYARIRSPIDGVTGVRLVDQGNVVHAADSTAIVVVTQIDPMSALFTLPQDELLHVSTALAAGPVKVEAYSRDGSTQLSAGQLTVIDNQVNQTTATIRLKATFPNPNQTLWPNVFLKLRLLLETLHGVTVIPAAAVQRGPQNTFVYVVGSDQTASVRPVEIKSVDSQIAVVTKGINAGEQVVVEGQNQLRPGAKVTVRTPAAGGAPPGGPPGASSSGRSSGSPRGPREDRGPTP